MSSMEPYRFKDFLERLSFIYFFCLGAFLRRLLTMKLACLFIVEFYRRCDFEDLADLADLWDREDLGAEYSIDCYDY